MTSKIQYSIPDMPLLLTTASFLYLSKLADTAFDAIINAGLIGSLAVGIVYGSEAANILPIAIEEVLIVLGYIGLLLLVFEAGLETNIKLLFKNIYLSTVIAFTGIGFPIAFSLILMHVGYGYGAVPAFGAGAALCSTSLGTTLALLRPEFKSTRTGTVLLSAALIDDIVGLVLAAIVPQLLPNKGPAPGNAIDWPTIVRPIGVSLAFGFGTPVLGYCLRYILCISPLHVRKMLHVGSLQVFLIVATASGFVAGARYAGTSELFGVYLAGALLAYVFAPQPGEARSEIGSSSRYFTPEQAFAAHFHPVLKTLLSPIFFASIGFSLPIRSLFAVNGSQQVIWRGIIYALLMVLGKVICGMWLFIWPDREQGRSWFGRLVKEQCLSRKAGGKDALPNQIELDPEDALTTTEHPERCTRLWSTNDVDASPKKAAIFVGFAMVPRGEIALIVAQLARPLLEGVGGEGSEPFSVVVWAILVTTVGGALAVGLLVRSWDQR